MTLHGLEAIARHLGVSRSTIHRWITRYHMPAAKSPNGRYLITDSLIDDWIRDMRQAQITAGEIPWVKSQ